MPPTQVPESLYRFNKIKASGIPQAKQEGLLLDFQPEEQ